MTKTMVVVPPFTVVSLLDEDGNPTEDKDEVAKYLMQDSTGKQFIVTTEVAGDMFKKTGTVQ